MRGLDLLEDCQYRVCSKCGHWHRASKRIFVHFKTLLFMSHLLQQKKKQNKQKTAHWSSKKLLKAEPESKKNKAVSVAAATIPGKKATLMGSRSVLLLWQGFYCPCSSHPFQKKRKTSEIKLCAKFDVCKLILLDRRKAVKQSGLVVLRARYCQIQARCTTTQEGVCVFEEQTQIIWKSHANSDWKAGQPF